MEFWSTLNLNNRTKCRVSICIQGNSGILIMYFHFGAIQGFTHPYYFLNMENLTMLYCTQDNRQNIRIKRAFLTVSLYNNVGGIFIGAPKEQRGGDTTNYTKGNAISFCSITSSNMTHFVDLRACIVSQCQWWESSEHQHREGNWYSRASQTARGWYDTIKTGWHYSKATFCCCFRCPLKLQCVFLCKLT